MDWPGAAAAALGSVITLAGVLLAGGLESRRERRRAAERREDEAQARIRERDLRALDETRQVLVGLLSWLEQRVVLGDIRATQPEVDALTRYNINLIADAEVITRYGEVVTALQADLPMTTSSTIFDAVRNALPKSLAELDTAMMQRTSRLRADLLQALDRQEERVMRGKPLAKLSRSELEEIAPADAMVDALRERQRAHRPPPDR